MSNNMREIADRINSNYGLIFVDSYEENRVIREVRELYPDPNKIYFWSATQGIHMLPPEGTKKNNYDKPYVFAPTDTPHKPSIGNLIPCLEFVENTLREKRNKNDMQYRSVFVLRDPDKFFNNPLAVRKLRDINYLVAGSSASIILLSPGCTIPIELEKDSAKVRVNLLDEKEIQNKILEAKIVPHLQMLNDRLSTVSDDHSKLYAVPKDTDLPIIAKACAGLTEDEILNSLIYSINTKRIVDPVILIEEKKQIINKNDILEYWDCKESVANVGGFDQLKNWFQIQQTVMDNPEAAKAYGADQPKGILLLGVQGSGKTLTAKALAKQWGRGIIKLEMGKVFAGLVGESEKRMRNALAQAEAAGGIVIIDEIDKGLAGAGSSDRTDGGTTKRVIGSLLTWMQEPHPGLFIVATANDISALIEAHPELLRKGRFDQIFFSDVPTTEEKKEIFSIHLSKRGRDLKKFDLDALASIKYQFQGKEYDYVGAEIEYAVKEAVSKNFSYRFDGKKEIKAGDKKDITTEDIIEQLQKLTPICKMAESPLNRMRDWAKDNAMNVSTKSQIVERSASEIGNFDSVDIR